MMGLNERIVEEAIKWKGVKYQHRSTTKQGCDCTGLVVGVMQALGYMKNYEMRNYPSDWNLHSMADNYILEEIKRFADRVVDMKSGDIILFRFGKCIAHAGILLENRLFIHNHKNAGKCNLSSLSGANKWARRFVGAYRFNIDKLKAA